MSAMPAIALRIFLTSALAGFPVLAHAADLPVQPRRAAPAPAATETTMHNYGKTDPKCSSWTDGCRTCKRGDAGAANCSNIGIACQAGEIRCTARQN